MGGPPVICERKCPSCAGWRCPARARSRPPILSWKRQTAALECEPSVRVARSQLQHAAARARANRRPRFRLGWRWIALLVGLLAINYWFGSRATQAPPRVRVPYSPFFLQQVDGGQRRRDHVEGHGDPGDVQAAGRATRGSKPTTRFKTEIPAFADTKALSQLLAAEGRRRQRRAARHAASPWWESLLLGFGPTILFIGLLVLLMRRAGERAERARRVRPLAGAPLRAGRRPR